MSKEWFSWKITTRCLIGVAVGVIAALAHLCAVAVALVVAGRAVLAPL